MLIVDADTEAQEINGLIRLDSRAETVQKLETRIALIDSKGEGHEPKLGLPTLIDTDSFAGHMPSQGEMSVTA